MVLGARLRTVMSSIIRWRKAEILPAGGTEYAEGLLLLMRATVMENPVKRHVGDSGNQVGVTTRRSWQPNATRRGSTFTDIAPGSRVIQRASRVCRLMNRRAWRSRNQTVSCTAADWRGTTDGG